MQTGISLQHKQPSYPKCDIANGERENVKQIKSSTDSNQPSVDHPPHPTRPTHVLNPPQPPSSLALLLPSTGSSNLRKQKLRSRPTSITPVGKVRGRDNQLPTADKITSVAEDLETVAGIVGDLTVVLLVFLAQACQFRELCRLNLEYEVAKLTVYPKSTVPTMLSRIPASTSRMDAAASAAPWLSSVSVVYQQNL